MNDWKRYEDLTEYERELAWYEWPWTEQAGRKMNQYHYRCRDNEIQRRRHYEMLDEPTPLAQEA